jgi:uncharacterized membrane protein
MSDDTTADRIIEAFSWRNFPADLRIVYLWLILAVLGIYLPVLNESPFRVVFALPVVLFIPGYCLIAALFPGNADIDGIERLALSFGLSIAVVPLIGLALNYTPWGIRLDPIVVSLVIFTVAMALAAQYRRSLLPPEERFFVPFRAMLRGVKDEFFSQEGTRLDRALSVILLVAIVAAVGTTIYVIVVPKEGEKFTEFYILGEKGKAADYPEDLFVGRPAEVIVGIGNHEYRNVTYVTEIWLTNTSFDTTTNTTLVDRMIRLDRFNVTLPHNETYQEPRSFTAPGTGYNQVKFLLFKDAAPPDSLTGYERINASYRDLHLWVTVRPPRG